MDNNRNEKVAVIGAGLTGLTTAFRLKQAGVNVTVIEKTDRVGGQICTHEQDGFIFESGPNTGVVSYPEVAELFESLGNDCRLETAREESKIRLIWKGDRFHALPSGLISAITTPLFSLYDKFRILGEPWRAKGTDAEESVGALARRRLGKSFLEYAVDPFLSGVYAGDPMALTTKYALPKLYNLEQTYGSFIRGSIAKAKMPKTERDMKATKKVFSAEGGLENLVRALAKGIGSENIITGADGLVIAPFDEGGYSVSYSHGGHKSEQVYDKVVTTVGAYELPAMLPFVESSLMGKISRLKYAPVVQVSVGYNDTGALRFNAFGGLVPSVEKRDVLGILFPSGCFGGRAPQRGAIFSFFIGGVKHRQMVDMPDAELEQLVRREAHSMLKLPVNKEPDMVRIFKHQRAIPQYGADSGERFDAIDKIQATYPGLILGGNIKGGIGMADRIRQAFAMADEIATR